MGASRNFCGGGARPTPFLSPFPLPFLPSPFFFPCVPSHFLIPFPLCRPLLFARGSGKRCKLPQRGPGPSILAYFKTMKRVLWQQFWFLFSGQKDVIEANLAFTVQKVTIAPLQRAQNAAARLAPHDHVTAALRHLHWLPVQYRITYKLCLLMHLVHIHKAPYCLKDNVIPTASVSSRGRLRSACSTTSTRYTTS